MFRSVHVYAFGTYIMCISLHTYPHILFTKIVVDVLFGYFVGARYSK